MKKLLLSLAAISMAVGAQATLYVVGEDQGWDIAKPTVVELDGNNEYVFTVYKPFKMSTTNPNGDWNTFNGAAKAPSTKLQRVQEQTVSLVTNSGNVNLPYGEGSVKFTVTVNAAFSSAKFVGETAPVAGEYDKVYLRGNGNWDTCTAENQFSTTDGVHYTMTGVSLNSEFKIADSVWGEINYGAENQLSLGVETPLVQNSTTNITVAGMPLANATLEFNLTNATLKVTGETTGGGGSGGDDNTDYSSWYVNVMGPFNNWEDNGVQPVDGISTTTGLPIGTQGFKVKIWNGVADSYYISESGSVATDKWVQMSFDGVNAQPTQVEGATESSVYTVKYNVVTNEIYVTIDGGSSDPVDPTPKPEVDTIYVVGEADGLSWELPGMSVAKGDDGNFTLNLTNLVKFRFSINNATAWDGEGMYNEGSYATGNTSFGDGVLNVGGETLSLIPWGSDQMVPWQGDYTITIAGDLSTITAYTTTPKPEGATPVYIMGDMNNWTAESSWEFVYDDKKQVYTYDCGSHSIGAGVEFKIADAKWSTINYTYGLEITPDDYDDELMMDFGGLNNNMSLSTNFSGVITFKITGPQEAYVIFSEPSIDASVSDIMNDSGETLYFNLQGVKINNPQKGEFLIKVTDGKAAKVVI